ncbi:MAG: hypothetical protein H0V62_03830 [Gammaproteobacteria bacterium]|nr:hypothetical protein [Gammaproteobacteria bacterium]
MSKPRMFSTAIGLSLIATLAGCYEAPTDVTNYEAGVYKGEQDPLLAKQREAEHLEALVQRFNMVQTDR